MVKEAKTQQDKNKKFKVLTDKEVKKMKNQFSIFFEEPKAKQHFGGRSNSSSIKF